MALRPIKIYIHGHFKYDYLHDQLHSGINADQIIFKKYLFIYN